MLYRFLIMKVTCLEVFFNIFKYKNFKHFLCVFLSRLQNNIHFLMGIHYTLVSNSESEFFDTSLVFSAKNVARRLSNNQIDR